MKAVAYSRVSGLGQVEGDGFDRQAEAITKYAEANQVEIVEWFRDEGVTGKMELEGRCGLSNCLALCREQSIALVLIEDSTRLARDMIVSEVIIREFQKLGVRVVAASGGVDLTAGDDSNPTAKMIRQILAAVAEFDRCVIVLKTRAARARARAKYGKCEGRKAFGFRDGEAAVLARMIAERNQGAALRQIADALNADGIPSRMGGPWKVGTVARILSRT
jgi:DNA invertase Pin-like site-specific DNA recombinase